MYIKIHKVFKYGLVKSSKIIYNRFFDKMRIFSLRYLGYRPSVFWQIWGYNFINEKIQEDIHPYNRRAVEIIHKANVSSIVEIGCGFGRNIKLMIESGIDPKTITGLDISESMINNAKSYLNNANVELIVGDFCQDSKINKKYEMVFIALVLMHIPANKVVRSVKKALELSTRYILIMEQYKNLSPETMIEYLENTPAAKYTFLHNYEMILKSLNISPTLFETFTEKGNICLILIEK